MCQSPKPPEPADALPYRPCVGQMVINPQGLVWAGARADSGNEPEGSGRWWQMPQGGIEDGEDPAAAARRELFEETGIRSVEQIGETADWLTYELPPELIGTAWRGRFRGQKQKWFAYRFTGSDDEVNIVPETGAQAEFSQWRWLPAGDLLELIVPFKREVYREVLAAFSGLTHFRD